MALDQFKTQVLLLHSEPRILDALSSGFDDRYTVHCATSGSEALTTLGETPINVIISAQDLPGMSGVEALREAKKRSPETVGILLAGGTDTDVEALVSAGEIFDVVRGNVTGDSLTQLVDQATQQMRLIALAESANDTTASVDDSQEHIVMETSENGSTIITGTAGRLEALDPEKAAAEEPVVGAQTIDILVLTKDREFLTTIKESSRGMHNLHHGTTLKHADDAILENKIGVAVIDAALVGEKVERLTHYLRQKSQRLVAIVAGRRDDGEMLMDLINRGKVYRFLLKPVSPGRARLAIEASVRHHLEAPEAAFHIEEDSGAPGATAKPARRPATKARPKKPTQPAAAPKSPAKASVAPVPVAEASDPPLGQSGDSSPIDEGLSAVFADKDTGLKETVTDMISTLGDALKGKKDEPSPAPDDTLAATGVGPAAENASGGPGIGKLLILGIAVAGVAAVAGGLYWLTSGDQPGPVATPPGNTATAPVAEAAVTPEPVADAAAEPAAGAVAEPVADALAEPAADAVAEPAADAVAEPVADALAEPAADAVAEPVAQSVAEPAAETAVEPGVGAEALIAQARAARDAGRIFGPAGDNAIELFAAAVEADPSNDFAAVELDAVIEDALAMAEAALLRSRSDEAAAALRRVALADPDNARLPFLTAQLSQVQLRTYLAAARIAMRDERFEDAANLLAAARELDIADRSEIEAVAAELGAARSEQRAEDGPEAASRLVLQAREAIDAGNLDDAEDLLARARAIDAQNSSLAPTQSALVAAREAIAARERRAAEERSAAERRAEDERRAAAEAAAARAAPTEQVAAPSEQVAAPSEQVAAPAEQVAAPTEQVAAPAEQVAAATEQVADATPTGPGSQQVTQPAGAADVSAQPPVPISSLSRTRYVAPRYPRAAARRGDSGWVDILFTVTFDGTTRDVEVRDSSPEGTFDNAAIRAVERWAFEPVVEGGEVVEKRAGVRMMFTLED